MPGVGNLYYLFELAAFCVAMYFAARGQKRTAADEAATTLLNTQNQLIEAQGKRIDLLQTQNTEQQKLIEKQASRIEYLEEVLKIHGPAQVVQT